VLEPGIEFRRQAAVEEDLHGLLLLAREFAHLQAAGVSGGLPIDVPGALEGLVGAYAVEVLAEAPVVGFDFAGDARGKIVESRLGIDGGVDQHVAPQGDARGFLQEAERKSRGEGEAVLAIGAALGEAHLHILFERGAPGDKRKVDARFENRTAGQTDGLHANGKRGREPLPVAHEEFSRNAAPGGDVFGHQKIEFQPG
jgi:hypothetical protein